MVQEEQEFVLPSLDGLDTRDPNYLKRVEEGLDVLEARLTGEEGRTESLALEQAEMMRRKLSEMGLGVKIDVGEDGIKLTGKGSMVTQKELEKIQRLCKRVGREYEVVGEGYRRRIEGIRFRLRQFRAAIVELTKVEALTEVRADPDTVTLYVVSGGKVFEYHLNARTRDFATGPSNLSEQVLYHPGFERQCRASGEEVNGDLYRAFNPSSRTPAINIARYGFGYARSAISRKYGAVPARLERAIEAFKEAINPEPGRTVTLA